MKFGVLNRLIIPFSNYESVKIGAVKPILCFGALIKFFPYFINLSSDLDESSVHEVSTTFIQSLYPENQHSVSDVMM